MRVQVAKNFLEYSVGSQQDVVVPETQHSISVDLQLSCAFGVERSLFRVLAAVNLDDEFRFDAGKVSDVAGD